MEVEPSGISFEKQIKETRHAGASRTKKRNLEGGSTHALNGQKEVKDAFVPTSGQRSGNPPLKVGLVFPSYSVEDKLYQSYVKRHLAVLKGDLEFKGVTPGGSLSEYGKEIKKLVEESDLLVISYDGSEVDTLASFASGYAFGLNKPVLAIRTDLRPAGESEKTNLMLSQSAYRLILPKDGSPKSVMTELVGALKECREKYSEGKEWAKGLKDYFLKDKLFDLPYKEIGNIRSPKVYQAGGLFTAGERAFDRIFEKVLKNASFFPLWPWRYAIPSDFQLPREKLDQVLFGKCIRGIHTSDVIVANTDGSKVDDGTAFEIGYGLALGKPTITYRTDFRKTEVLKQDGPQRSGVFEGILPIIDVSLPSSVDSYIEPIKTDLLNARESLQPVVNKMKSTTEKKPPAPLPEIVARFGDLEAGPIDQYNDDLQVVAPLPFLDSNPEKFEELVKILLERVSQVAFHYGKEYGKRRPSVTFRIGDRSVEQKGDFFNFRGEKGRKDFVRKSSPLGIAFQTSDKDLEKCEDELDFQGPAGGFTAHVTYVSSNQGRVSSELDRRFGLIPGHLVVRFVGPGYGGGKEEWLDSDEIPSTPRDGYEGHPSPRELRDLARATKDAIRDFLRNM